jgi:uncharacterized membrane protein
MKLDSKSIKQIIFISIVFPVLDLIYLYLNATHFTHQIESVQHKKVVIRFVPFILCYALLIFELFFFVVQKEKSIFYAFLSGIVIYGVYQLSNYAIFQDWKLYTVVTDILWGGVISAIVTYMTYKAIP